MCEGVAVLPPLASQTGQETTGSPTGHPVNYRQTTLYFLFKNDNYFGLSENRY
jgi:hypothetical protein